MTNQPETITQSGFGASSTNIDFLREQLLDLFCNLAYQEGDFILSSGLRSSYYVNKTQVTLHPQGALFIGRIVLSMLSADTQAVSGLTMGADPIVTSVSVMSALENRPIPALIVRKEAKGHGTKAYIEGPTLAEGSKITVLEDVVTTGKSALKAVERLRDAGYEIDTIISLVDRKQGGAELYKSNQLKFLSVFDITQIQTRFQELKS